MERIVVAYSGGLDTSVAIRWLAEEYGAEIVAVTLDIGQGRELADIRERALALGAIRAHVIDAREEFVRDYIIPALQAGALYEDGYPLATALARPLVARRLVEIARMERATAVAHDVTRYARFDAIFKVRRLARERTIDLEPDDGGRRNDHLDELWLRGRRRSLGRSCGLHRRRVAHRGSRPCRCIPGCLRGAGRCS